MISSYVWFNLCLIVLVFFYFVSISYDEVEFIFFALSISVNLSLDLKLTSIISLWSDILWVIIFLACLEIVAITRAFFYLGY